MASNSGWSKGLPSGSSNIALGDNDIRSNQSVMQAAWEDEHYLLDGSANSAGVHKEGSARAYYEGSAPTAILPQGQLWMNSTSKGAYVASAAGTTSWQSARDPDVTTADLSVTASGTLAQGNSQLTQFLNVIAGSASSNECVTLPAAVLGKFCLVKTLSNNTLHIFPPSGAGIDNFGSNNTFTPLFSSSGKYTVLFYSTAANWYSISQSIT